MSENCSNCGSDGCYGCNGEFTADPDAVDWHPHGGYRDSDETAGNDWEAENEFEEWDNDAEYAEEMSELDEWADDKEPPEIPF